MGGRRFYQGQRVDKHTIRIRKAIADLTLKIKDMSIAEKVEFISKYKFTSNYEAYAKKYMINMLELASKKDSVNVV